MVDNGTEYMVVEQSVLPFASYQLNSLSSLIGSDDVSSIVESDLSVSFCNLVAKLCAEIAILHGMDESVEEIANDSGIKGFLFDLSAFLGELECPHECITCGPIEERFISSSRRKFLFNYLMAEMKTARLFALRTIETCRNADSTNGLSSEMTTAMNTLNIPKPTGSVNLATVIATLQNHAERKLQSVPQRPRLLFRPSSMDSGRWKQVESVVRALGQDCRSRHLLLLKRMDVTVNSFLWSDKIRKHEEKIRSFYSEQRDKISQLSVPGISALISASDDLLKIEQASSKKRREHTKSHLKPEGVNAAPADRGGRTDDIRGLRNESFAEQRFNDGNRGRGGFRGNRGRGGYGRGGRGGFQMSHENIVRQEYQNRSGRGDQGDKRGRGRGNY